jgi:two-component system sensor histidine kinase DesK
MNPAITARWRDVRAALRPPRWIIVAVHVGFLVIPIFFCGSRFPEGDWSALLLVVPLAVAMLALQLPISFALVRGERPSHLWWRLFGVCALSFLPLWWLTASWMYVEVFLVGSLVLLQRRTSRAVMITVLWLLRWQVDLWWFHLYPSDAPADIVVFNTFYVLGWPLSLLGAFVGSVLLVRTLEELHTSRSQLARMAVERERARLARDLHDLLGQSLSAVSLKGDLALRLLRSDPEGARAEIEGLTAVAREALHGSRAITSDRHAVSLRTEVEGASHLLSAAGVDARIAVDVPELTSAAEEVLAWAVREGVTNVLRHSDARECVVTAAGRGGAVRLEMVNDGAHPPSDEGSGLAGLGERARTLSGTVATDRHDDGRFRLLVEIPREAS